MRALSSGDDWWEGENWVTPLQKPIHDEDDDDDKNILFETIWFKSLFYSKRIFWKIVYDENTKKGIAVIGTNNPYRLVVSGKDKAEITMINIQNRTKNLRVPYWGSLAQVPWHFGHYFRSSLKCICIRAFCERIHASGETWLLVGHNPVILGPVYCCSLESFLLQLHIDVGADLDISGGLLI